MKISEFEARVDLTQWKRLGKGGYNTSYLSDKVYTIEGHTCRWVFKKPTKFAESTVFETSLIVNTPERAIRKWQLINPHYPAWRISNGWIAPYMEPTNKKTKSASDKKIAHKLIKIYQATGNVIADACGINNFLVSGDEVVCIDVDLAVQQDSDGSEYARSMIINQPTFDDYLDQYEKNSNKRRTVDVTKTLLYLDREACDFPLKKEHITAKMIDTLHGFRERKAALTAHTMDMLWHVIHLDPSNKIKNNDITPDLIMHLEMEQNQGIKITKKRIMKLIHHETTRQEQANIVNVFDSLCDTLPTDDTTLLASWDAETSAEPSRLGFFNPSAKKQRLCLPNEIKVPIAMPQVTEAAHDCGIH